MIEKKEQLMDLQTSEALFGLSADERAELDRLTREFPELQDDSLALTAAAVAMAELDTSEELPAHLSESVVREYERLYAKPSTVPGPAAPIASPIVGNIGLFGSARLGWGLAAAASALLAFNVLSGISDRSPVAVVPQQKIQTPADERAALMSSAGDAVTVAWAVDEKKPSGVTGDVVWSQSQQKGYMRFKGLAANDRSKETYQLWIFDANQPEATPVDGGVFDVDSDGEVIVPIDAKIRVGDAIAFAVTVEKPGGVVVSKREKIAAIAKVGA
jgi:anti-sigma-K factor RskA